MNPAHILHLALADEYRAQEQAPAYLPRQFAMDGFIHCTREPEVLLRVANAVYRDVPGDFLVLVIDPAKVAAEVRFEPPTPPAPADSPLAGHLFPHIYGPLNCEAIVAVRSARRGSDGSFLAV